MTTPFTAEYAPAATSGRRIVLLGNCQLAALKFLLERYLTPRTGDVLTYISPYQQAHPDTLPAIESADLVVHQILDMPPDEQAENAAASRPRILVPMITAAFLWPYSGVSHPAAATDPDMHLGPFNLETGDSFLNAEIAAGTPPEEAADRYLAADPNRRIKLDRLYELLLDKQRARDEQAGFRMAPLIERYFRTEPIFLTPYHPNLRLALALAEALFRRFGAREDEIDRLLSGTRTTPFPPVEQPIHPAVASHFGLTYAPPHRRYRLRPEGDFTIRDYALRYMRNDWNRDLVRGMEAVRANNAAEALTLLGSALITSPDAAIAHHALSRARLREGDPKGALRAAREAARLEPETAEYSGELGVLLRQAGALEEALTALSAAAALDPGLARYQAAVAQLLRQMGRMKEACAAMREAARREPCVPRLKLDLAGLQEEAGDAAGALVTLADLAREQAEDNALFLRLNELRGRLGQAAGAADEVRARLATRPDDRKLRLLLIDLCLRQEDAAAAAAEARRFTELAPDFGEAWGKLGHALMVQGDLPGAETALMEAAQLEPDRAHYWHELSIVFTRQKRFAEAVAAAKTALRLEPKAAQRRVHVEKLRALAEGGVRTA